ncbi:MAG: prepilin-type N-terminal cleavage/methylation domain-containing protein [Rickettsiales bacterium]|nr:prepilin-type N-terminal cleavage/methylation domain-containing protein [Rickettsiales bacterium]
MKKTFSSKKSAFSLIELSIVLIIIGLLIAGVTGGASLIKSSELRSAISEARGYAVAVSGFYSQYNALPGDYTTAVAGSAVSDTTYGLNSKIQYNNANITTYSSESVVAWDQLIKTGTIDNSLNLTSSNITNSQAVGTNMPASKIKFAGWHFDYRIAVTSATDAAYTTSVSEGKAASPAYQNVVVLTGATTASTTVANTLVNGSAPLATASLTGPDALSIDTKVDDGFANAGRVRGLLTTCYTASASANTGYIVSSASSKVCALTFQVDVNS